MKKQSKKDRSIWIVFITLALLIIGTVIVIVSAISVREASCEHEYDHAITTVEASSFCVGERRLHCKKCGDEITQRIHATIDMPQLYLDGVLDGISKSSECFARATYVDGKDSTETYASIKYQGHTSILFDKKNYTIKFYTDESRRTKHKISVNGWEPTHKYCLKANYIDFSGARNVVSASIWSDVVASRAQLNESIAQLEFYGGIDGFPVALFINGEYQGLYTFNIPKDERTYNIADNENEAMFVINSDFSDSANFKAEMTEEDKKTVFDLEYSYLDDKVWPYERMNDLLRFVKVADGETFRTGIGEYLDVNAAIDYLITAYVLGATDNFSKNMILLTYNGKQWIPNMYDLDTACGLAFDGSSFEKADFCMPSISKSGEISSGTENLLWDKLLNNYSEEFKKRYFELRSDVLSNENLIARYAAFIESVPAECYRQEAVLYPNLPGHEVDQLQQITAFLSERGRLLDAVVDKFNK